MVLANELVIERSQDVKADQKEQEYCDIKVKRQENKGEAEPTARAFRAAGARSITLKTRVAARLVIIPASERWPRGSGSRRWESAEVTLARPSFKP